MWAGFALVVAAFGACAVTECENRAEGHICDTSGVADTALLRVDVESAKQVPTDERDMYAPTPAPSQSPSNPSASGDPHMKNANNQNFEINHPGEWVLARIPRHGPALLQLSGIVEQLNNPCNHFFTSVSLKGAWLGDDVVSVRAQKNSSWLDEEDTWPFGIQMEQGGPWTPLANFSAGNETVLKTYDSNAGARNVRVELNAMHNMAPRGNLSRMRKTQLPSEGFFSFAAKDLDRVDGKPAVFKLSAKLFWINIDLKRLKELGHSEIGGALGTESPDPKWAEPTDNCKMYHETLLQKRGHAGTVHLFKDKPDEIMPMDIEEWPYAMADL